MIKIQITTRKLFYAMIITGILYFISQGIILYILNPIGIDAVMRFQLTFDSESIAALLNAWGDAGIETFKEHFYFDFLHPLWYSAFLFFTMLFLQTKLSSYNKSESVPKYIYIPFVAAFLDIAENFLEIDIINQRLNLTSILVFTTGIVSLLKWLISLISLIIIASLAVRLAVQARRARDR